MTTAMRSTVLLTFIDIDMIACLAAVQLALFGYTSHTALCRIRNAAAIAVHAAIVDVIHFATASVNMLICIAFQHIGNTASVFADIIAGTFFTGSASSSASIAVCAALGANTAIQTIAIFAGIRNTCHVHTVPRFPSHYGGGAIIAMHTAMRHRIRFTRAGIKVLT